MCPLHGVSRLGLRLPPCVCVFIFGECAELSLCMQFSCGFGVEKEINYACLNTRFILLLEKHELKASSAPKMPPLP